MKRIVQTAGRNALKEFSPEFAYFNLAIEVPGVDCSNEWCEAVSEKEYVGLR